MTGPSASALSFLLMYATFGALALRALFAAAQQGRGHLMADAAETRLRARSTTATGCG